MFILIANHKRGHFCDSVEYRVSEKIKETLSAKQEHTFSFSQTGSSSEVTLPIQ